MEESMKREDIYFSLIKGAIEGKINVIPPDLVPQDRTEVILHAILETLIANSSGGSGVADEIAQIKAQIGDIHFEIVE